MSDQAVRRRLADWFLQWRAPLRKFLIRKKAVPAADLEDVAQEVFLRLLRYDQTDLIANPQAYLYKMAVNVAAEWAIRARQTTPFEPESLEALREAEDGTPYLEYQEDIKRALLLLTPAQRTVVKLQFFDGLSRPEIAARLDVSERSVKRVLLKSYSKLRQQLNSTVLKEFTDGTE